MTDNAASNAARLTAVALVLFLSAAGSSLAFGQDPPDTIPANAKRDVRDLRYVVQDLAGRVEDLRVRESDFEYRIELAADVLFDFDQWTLKPEAERVLTRAAAFIREHAVGPVRIEGHTDAKGTESYNQRLSDRRAASVRSWLTTTGGLGAVTFSTKGFGAKQPVAPNTRADGTDDPDGRQKNRRVEIIIAKKA